MKKHINTLYISDHSDQRLVIDECLYMTNKNGP